MTFIKSLRQIREMVNTEIRNNPTTAPRYTTAELDAFIRKAVTELSPYFWYEEEDSTKTFASTTYSYVYDAPVANIRKVSEVRTNLPPKVLYDWDEIYDPNTHQTTLMFQDDHTAGATIKVTYERHPIPPPGDLTLSEAISVAAIDVPWTKDTTDWPSSGYFEARSANDTFNEYIKYSGIAYVVAAGPAYNATITVTARGQFGSSSTYPFAVSDVISYCLVSDSYAFFTGIVDLVTGFVNRMRIIDAPSGDVAGNVTVMREIMDDFGNWIRAHKMRSKAPVRRPRRVSRTLRKTYRKW